MPTKKAERTLTDAGKFPSETCREKLARKWGEDAVALSGPCEGSKLADCVCTQLQQRWDKISERFAGDTGKVEKLAVKLAKSFMEKDDSDKCASDLQASGFDKQAAAGITDYLRAYAIGPATDEEIDGLMNQVSEEDGTDELGDIPGEEAPAEVAPESPEGIPGEEPVDVPFETVEEPIEPPAGGMEGLEAPGEVPGEEMVTIEIPADVAKELVELIGQQVGEGGGIGEGLDLRAPEGDGLGDVEIVDDLGAEAPEGEIAPEGAPAAEPAGVPGEMPENQEPGVQTVTGKPEEACATCSAASPAAPAPAEKGCACAESGKPPVCQHEGHEEHEEHKEHDKHESPAHEKSETPAEEKKEHQFGEKKEEESEETKSAKEAMKMRTGHILRVGETILKLGPEMHLNNTDQLGGHSNMQLGTAKEKAAEEPKALEDGNVKAEAYTANDSKFSDGKTMGKEQKFDPKSVDKGSVTGGNASLMGKDESYPKGGPSVPAGSSAIGGEPWTGGDVSTKGTVIAEFVEGKGLMVTAGGKKFLAPTKIVSVSKELVEAIGNIKFDGDGKKFAQQALKLIRQAEKSGLVDGVTKTDTSKLEGSNFTNDAKKEPEEGGAQTEKGKAAPTDKGVVKTDTSKLEAEKFTNDADKKPEDKAAASDKEVKTAADKKVEEPKALENGNVKPEGYTANDSKFSDGKTMGHEQKFDPKEPGKVSGGEASLMGKDESLPKGGPSVPAGGGKMGQEPWDGGDVSTKGTVIANDQASETKKIKAEAELNMARLTAASVYVADLLRNGDIKDGEYKEALAKFAQMPVQAIQALARSTVEARARVAKTAAASSDSVKTAGCGIPIVVSSNDNEKTLKDKLVEMFKITKNLNEWEKLTR